MLVKGRRITDDTLLTLAEALADLTTPEDAAAGRLYPAIVDL